MSAKHQLFKKGTYIQIMMNSSIVIGKVKNSTITTIIRGGGIHNIPELHIEIYKEVLVKKTNSVDYYMTDLKEVMDQDTHYFIYTFPRLTIKLGKVYAPIFKLHFPKEEDKLLYYKLKQKGIKRIINR